MDKKEFEAEKKKLMLRLKNKTTIKFEMRVTCPYCGGTMEYIYGETYRCLDCGKTKLSDFGKVKEYLEKNGPQNANTISEETGVSIKKINEFLREGRIEIPDGSDVYIKCQGCGADIRYGRFCPECMKKLTDGLSKAIWMPETGERPTNRGKMHTDIAKGRK